MVGRGGERAGHMRKVRDAKRFAFPPVSMSAYANANANATADSAKARSVTSVLPQ